MREFTGPQPAAPGDGFAEVHTVARDTLMVMVVTFFGLGANYLYGIYVARQLAADAFGLYSIGLSLFNLLGILSVMGLDSAVLRFVPGAWAHGRNRTARSTLRSALLVGLLIGSLAAISLWAASETLSLRVFSKEALARALPFFALAIPAYALGTILLSGLQALHDVKWRMLVKYVSEPAVKFAVTAVLIWAGLGLFGALMGLVTALWLSVLLSGLVLRWRIAAGKPAAEGWAGDEVTIGTVAKYATPLLTGMVFSVIASRSDILLLGYFLPASEVGIYAAALQTAGIIVIVLQSVESIIAARLSDSLSHGRIAETREMYRLSLRWAVMIAVPLVLVFTLWPGEILSVFGHGFREGAAAFVVMALAQFVNLATGSANYMLLLSGRSRIVMFNEVANGTLQVGLNLYLIPHYGIVGAAVALLLSVTVVNVLRLLQVWRYLRIQPYDWILLKPLAAAGVGYAGALTAMAWLPGDRPLWLLPVVVAVYAASLSALGLHDQDRAALAGILTTRTAGRRATIDA